MIRSELHPSRALPSLSSESTATIVGRTAPRCSAFSSRTSAVADPCPAVRSTSTHESFSFTASSKALNTSVSFVNISVLIELSFMSASVSTAFRLVCQSSMVMRMSSCMVINDFVFRFRPPPAFFSFAQPTFVAGPSTAPAPMPASRSPGADPVALARLGAACDRRAVIFSISVPPSSSGTTTLACSSHSVNIGRLCSKLHSSVMRGCMDPASPLTSMVGRGIFQTSTRTSSGVASVGLPPSRSTEPRNARFAFRPVLSRSLTKVGAPCGPVGVSLPDHRLHHSGAAFFFGGGFLQLTASVDTSTSSAI
mmetsp:Transcript_1729/g.4875  ORF Transcript_1729/g.4875 Transcript_1729/m.4875 type:complete len:309 (+) Transcript_1729:2938-3864(+)